MASVTRALTQNDNLVLSQLLDPESTPSDIKIDSSLPSDPHITSEQMLLDVQIKEMHIIRAVEATMHPSTSPSEKKLILNQAETELQSLQQEYQYAGLWNDLTQVIRLNHGDDILFPSHSSPVSQSAISAAHIAISASETVIALLTPSAGGAKLCVSPLQARVLSSALLQRGALYNAAYKHLLREPTAKSVLKQFEGWSKEDFQDAASEAFFEAGKFGNKLGRALAVHTNPAAKLCGQVVKDAMRREFGMHRDYS